LGDEATKKVREAEDAVIYNEKLAAKKLEDMRDQAEQKKNEELEHLKQVGGDAAQEVGRQMQNAGADVEQKGVKMQTQ